MRALITRIVETQAEADAALQSSPPDFAAAGAAQNELRSLLDELARLTGVSSTPASNPSNGGSQAPAAAAEGSGDGPPATTSTTTTEAVQPASA